MQRAKTPRPGTLAPYTEAVFARYLVDGLGRKAPTWLSLVADELEAQDRLETATYSMACFWSGEAHLGTAEGVMATRTGWQEGREVVEVRYDPNRVSKQDLGRHAERGGARSEPTKKVRATPSDDRYRLRRTEWASIPMTPAQATRANALLAQGQNPDVVFSPRQLAKKGGKLGTLGATLDLRGSL